MNLQREVKRKCLKWTQIGQWWIEYWIMIPRLKTCNTQIHIFLVDWSFVVWLMLAATHVLIYIFKPILLNCLKFTLVLSNLYLYGTYMNLVGSTWILFNKKCVKKFMLRLGMAKRINRFCPASLITRLKRDWVGHAN